MGGMSELRSGKVESRLKGLYCCSEELEFIPVGNKEPLKDLSQGELDSRQKHQAVWEEGMKQLVMDRGESQEIFMRMSERVKNTSQVSGVAFQ